VINAEQQKVLETIEQEQVRFVDLLFTGILGDLKCVTVPEEELDGIFSEDKSVDGSSLLGHARLEESDQVLVPDPKTFRVYPYPVEAEIKSGCMICTVHNPDRSPFEGSPRNVLQRVVDQAESEGFGQFCVAPEMEFFLFQPSAEGQLTPLPYDHGGYFDSGTNDPADSIRKQMIVALRKMGIQVEFGHHEVAQGQHELDFRYGPAIETADRTMLLKQVVKAVAQRNGSVATFMPKPMHGSNGSGMHTHFSLWKDGTNLFYDPSGSHYRFSDLARSFIAGLLTHVRELSAVLNPLVNSYKRLVPGYEAPVYVSWASINRSALIRVPNMKESIEFKGKRAEIRSPDPSCNPYLAFALILAAGIDGIKKKLEPPTPVDRLNLYHLSIAERRERGIATLPGSLEESLKEFQNSAFAREVLGEHLFDKYLSAKWQEWDLFREAVTDWELNRYLPLA